jgi:hypothetical protein
MGLEHRLAFLALAVACVGACSKRQAPNGVGPVDRQAVPSARAVASASEPETAPHEPPTKAGCRALAVTGVVTLDGAPLAISSFLDGEHWLELAAGSSIALRHTETSREFRLIGPGHALPCRNGSEQILLADGKLSTSANLGVRPGAEVLIATPQAVVHYGDAALDLELGSKGLRVRVKQGEAWVEPQERSQAHFENPVRSGAEARLPRTPATVGSAVDACGSAARAAESSAQRVLGHESAGGSDSLGSRAAVHMRERSKARAACASAAAAVFSEPDPATRQRLSAAVAHADTLWQSVPRARP